MTSGTRMSGDSLKWASASWLSGDSLKWGTKLHSNLAVHVVFIANIPFPVVSAHQAIIRHPMTLMQLWLCCENSATTISATVAITNVVR